MSEGEEVKEVEIKQEDKTPANNYEEQFRNLNQKYEELAKRYEDLSKQQAETIKKNITQTEVKTEEIDLFDDYCNKKFKI